MHAKGRRRMDLMNLTLFQNRSIGLCIMYVNGYDISDCFEKIERFKKSFEVKERKRKVIDDSLDGM